MNFDKNLMGSSSEMLLLSLLSTQDMYGYQMIKELKSRSDDSFDFKEGTLYPILHKMESKGLVRSYEQVAENGRNRTYYAITDEGRNKYREQLAQWEEFSRSVDKVVSAQPAMA
ncbi:MAG: helix-turn-helix transcriptional regulator [Ruminococcaceae bacterium]|nr:helix-turn-helix transcriptional regulator [Oscillospiraceae bacterium]